MKGTNNGKEPQSATPFDLLADLDGDSSGPTVSWTDVDGSLLARFVESVSRTGGISTLGHSRNDNSLYCSVRWGDNKRAWVAPTTDAFGVIAKQVIGACDKMLSAPPAPTPIAAPRRPRLK